MLHANIITKMVFCCILIISSQGGEFSGIFALYIWAYTYTRILYVCVYAIMFAHKTYKLSWYVFNRFRRRVLWREALVYTNTSIYYVYLSSIFRRRFESTCNKCKVYTGWMKVDFLHKDKRISRNSQSKCAFVSYTLMRMQYNS